MADDALRDDVNGSRHATMRHLLRRRIGFAMAAVLAWVTVLWMIWCFPITSAGTQPGGVETLYGLVGWIDINSASEQTGVAAIFPVQTAGLTNVRPMGMTVGIVLTVAVTMYLLFATGRTFRNLTPRWICRHCGQRIDRDGRRGNLCPECGRLPNEELNVWAFWRND